MDWKQYEKEISDYFRSEYPDATVIPDAKIKGKYSKIERQIDLLIEGEMAEFRFRAVVDGKYRNTKIDVNDVEAFMGLARDVEADKGVMISTEGYSSAAMNRAYYDDSGIELDVLNFKEPEPVSCFWCNPLLGQLWGHIASTVWLGY
ncbi:MAG: restriction endonuclease [Candidatus Methylomirabilis sp.]|nr:restriction endonuclease [Candidatus Methylomirabilis sp.]